jgi:hypothetical protein
VSEVLRADHRGTGKVSMYQIMGVTAIVYSVAFLFALDPDRHVLPNLSAGVNALWRPEVVLFLQGLWAVVFMFFGKSMVTGAEISFHVYQDRI